MMTAWTVTLATMATPGPLGGHQGLVMTSGSDGCLGQSWDQPCSGAVLTFSKLCGEQGAHDGNERGEGWKRNGLKRGTALQSKVDQHFKNEFAKGGGPKKRLSSTHTSLGISTSSTHHLWAASCLYQSL